MTHGNTHTDAMLRHLGAAYYESLHGRASAADVARARTKLGIAIAANKPMIATTIMISTSVKPAFFAF